MSCIDDKELVHVNPSSLTSPTELSLAVVPAAAAPRRLDSAVVRYKECRKNHAAAIGGNANDGCGEFMPSGEEGSQEALKCSACSCHRNFHRKEVQGTSYSSKSSIDLGRNHKSSPNKAFMNCNTTNGSTNPLESEDKDKYDEVEDKMTLFTLARPEGDGNNHANTTKKRFRTKFTQEQKQKMLNFAENAGWKIKNLEESQIQQFCQEIGIQRRVLKVWMHNNRNHFAKKSSTS